MISSTDVCAKAEWPRIFKEVTSSGATRHLLQQEGWRRDKPSPFSTPFCVEKVPEGRMRSLLTEVPS